MAMAKPTVSSDIGEPKYVIKNGENGFLADTKTRFIEYMHNLAEDCNLRKTMGARARESINKGYALNIMGKRLFDALMIM